MSILFFEYWWRESLEHGFNWRLIPKGYLEVSPWCKPPVYAVRRYIEEQAEHHRECSFREEYLELLRGHDVQFDEDYV